jgi:predicted ATPase
VLRELLSLYQFRAEMDKAARLSADILALGERENNPTIKIDGHLAVGLSIMFIDDLEGGLRHLDSAIALFPTVPAQAFGRRVGNDPRIACLTTAAFTLWLLGFPDRAVGRANDALALAAELDHPFSSAFSRFHSGLLHLWRREYELVLDRAAGLIDVAERHDLQIWSAVGTCLLGAAQAGLGRFEEGLANISKGMGLYQGLRSPPVFWGMLLWVDAGARYGAGRPAEALGSIDEAIRIMSSDDRGSLLPEFRVLKGDALLALAADGGSDVASAEQCFQQAFDHAASLKARMSQLRAATRLCRLRREKTGQDAAVRALASVYATFTEGFATADLIEARDLLGEAAPIQPSGS